MRVLITGGSGFIGSHLAERLLAKGDEVLVIDNFDTGRRDNLTAHPKLTVIEGSIDGEELVAASFDDFQPEIVLHAAASYKDPENYAQDIRTNVLGTAVVVKNAKRLSIRRLIYLQTALCYGHPQEKPITLNHPIRPNQSSYAFSKTAGEQYIQLSGVNSITFRLANVYGPRNLSGPLPTFYHRLSTGKPCFVADARRDFVFVTDLIDILEKAVAGVGSAGVYHVSSGKDVSIKELFDAAVKAMGITLDQPVEVRPRSAEDVETILLDPSKTLKDFKQIPSTPLSEGVKKAIRYYKEYGVTQTFTHLPQRT